MNGEPRYTSEVPSRAYQANWERIYKSPPEASASDVPGLPAPVVEAPGLPVALFFGPLSAQCPTCHAHPGFPCKDASGFSKVLVHGQRRNISAMCAEGGR